MDIVPTREVWARMDADLARRCWHWLFHLPELLAGSNVAAIDHYVRAYRRPAGAAGQSRRLPGVLPGRRRTRRRRPRAAGWPCRSWPSWAPAASFLAETVNRRQFA
jgi:hypothetical protein